MRSYKVREWPAGKINRAVMLDGSLLAELEEQILEKLVEVYGSTVWFMEVDLKVKLHTLYDLPSDLKLHEGEEDGK